MLAPLEATNGTNSLPSLTFDSDPDTGLYRIGANNLGVTAGGTKIVDVATTGVAVTGTLAVSGATTLTGVALAADGTKTAPGVGFSSDTDTGLYRIGANNPAMSAGDTKVQDWTTAGTTITGTLGVSGAATLSNGLTLNKAGDNLIELGTGIAQAAALDFGGSAVTYADHALRILRDSGDNGAASITQRGTGTLNIATNEAAALAFKTTATERVTIAAGGAVTIATPSTSNATALTVTGNGSGSAISATGGSGGAGLTVAGVGAGVAISATAGTDANGMSVTGGANGAYTGIYATGGPGGAGGYMLNGTAATGGSRQDALRLTNGDLDMSEVANATLTTSVTNRLTPTNIPKVWSSFKITGGNGGGNFAISSQDGFNVTSVARTTQFLTTVTFGGDLSNTTYAVMPHVSLETAANYGYGIQISSRAAGSLVFYIYQGSGAGSGSIDLDAASNTLVWTINIVVFGRQ